VLAQWNRSAASFGNTRHQIQSAAKQLTYAHAHPAVAQIPPYSLQSLSAAAAISANRLNIVTFAAKNVLQASLTSSYRCSHRQHGTREIRAQQKSHSASELQALGLTATGRFVSRHDVFLFLHNSNSPNAGAMMFARTLEVRKRNLAQKFR